MILNRNILFSVILLIITGCSLYDSGRGYKSKNERVLLYTGYNTHISDSIDINGYYCRSDKPNRGYIFYDNGTCVSFDFLDEFRDTIGYPLTQLMTYIYTMPDVAYYKTYDTFASTGGTYKVENNTIIADFYIERINGLFHWPYWEIYSQYFNLIDKHMLRLCKTIIYDKEGTDTIYTNMQYNFVHVDTIPSYFHVDARKKKWLWNNKNDWKGYKRELKAYKDSIKRARKLKTEKQ